MSDRGFHEDLAEDLSVFGARLVWLLLVATAFLGGFVVGYRYSGEPSTSQFGAFIFGYGFGWWTFLILFPLLFHILKRISIGANHG